MLLNEKQKMSNVNILSKGKCGGMINNSDENEVM